MAGGIFRLPVHIILESQAAGACITAEPVSLKRCVPSINFVSKLLVFLLYIVPHNTHTRRLHLALCESWKWKA